MKLKYFLRGLGSGVVITAIILTVSFQGRSGEISDKEIIKRAEALGMVSKEKTDLLAENNENTAKDEVTVTEEAEPTTTEETQEAEPTNTEGTEEATTTPEETEEATATPEETQEATATPEPTKEATATPEPTKEPTATPEPTEEPTVEPAQPSTEKKVITIVSGMWSDKVARELEAMGAIEDAVDFDQYLIANGYANRIVVGTFEIPAGATYEQIAQIITNR